MTKRMQNGRKVAVKAVAGKARAGRSASVMKPEYLALLKNSEEGRRTMCEAVERIAERRGARVKRETMLATAKRLLANGKLMLKEIAQCTGLSLAQVRKLQAERA